MHVRLYSYDGTDAGRVELRGGRVVVVGQSAHVLLDSMTVTSNGARLTPADGEAYLRALPRQFKRAVLVE